ncbi:2-amino-4-hydroxy-6-hydroxymethyldihydropteridine diphosphokinase [Roseinatronobacter alkalisoli]|uniref:2-amino-4-hydroxy-6-hydroxymethyldihydropteridine pyrophosphokinase n=1 Tax=Roseinatronobacter alkalisoli TaxID=3028235 RepID=A0ABT5T428_9RHOB|nr:2-amino-4-hydroxy-6-hydroxymethyldihydropteridine diphosphokinase [Roseinatronobacter sp. HJB301]MDD7969883.1 2-amino-4-hydroxy-6-hydroxymethyldihydropteridine diphosphokinase [Roseinatronobacter sp. HJB301]
MLDIANRSEFNPILVALGSNLAGHSDSPIAQLRGAIDEMSKKSFKIIARSRCFRTPCFPAGAGPDFVNAVIVCECDLGPRAVLDALHSIEDAAGRHRSARWQARVLDLDLLAMGGQVLPDMPTYRQWAELEPGQQMKQAPPELILPHPRIQDRGFVLVPLMDVAPDWVHPVSGQTVRAMHAALDPAELAQITPISH